MTMLSPAEDFKDIIESESSFNLDFATNLFLNRVPDVPDNCVTILNSGGYPPAVTLGNDVQLHYPSVQIIVRNRSALIGYNLAFQIKQLLHGRGPEIWNQTTYMSIVCDTEPSILYWDEKSRCYLSLNFRILRRP